MKIVKFKNGKYGARKWSIIPFLIIPCSLYLTKCHGTAAEWLLRSHHYPSVYKDQEFDSYQDVKNGLEKLKSRPDMGSVIE
jgi:hypothetical protein